MGISPAFRTMATIQAHRAYPAASNPSRLRRLVHARRERELSGFEIISGGIRRIISVFLSWQPSTVDIKTIYFVESSISAFLSS